MDILQRYNKKSFHRHAETIPEMIEQFTKTETGVDLSFENLPNQAQEISYKLFIQARDETHLVELLDSHQGLREIFEPQPSGYIKEVDTIMRFYRFIESV